MLLDLLLQWKSYQRLNEINRRMSGVSQGQYLAQRQMDRSRRNGLLLLAGAMLLGYGLVCSLGMF